MELRVCDPTSRNRDVGYPGFVVARADRRDGWGYPALVVGTAPMARISVCYCTVSGIGVVVVKEPLVAVTVTE